MVLDGSWQCFAKCSYDGLSVGSVFRPFFDCFKLVKIKSNVLFLDYRTFKNEQYQWFRLDTLKIMYDNKHIE